MLAIALPDIAEVGALDTAGYLRDVWLQPDVRLGVGADLTVYAFPSGLEPVYGDFPLSFHVYLRLRWGRPHASGPSDAHGAH